MSASGRSRIGFGNVSDIQRLSLIRYHPIGWIWIVCSKSPKKIKRSTISYKGSSHVRKSGQVLMRSILQAKEDPSPPNTNTIWFQGFIWPNFLVPHGGNRTDGVASPETVAFKAFKALDLCPLTSDIWYLSSGPLVPCSWFLVRGSWFLFPDFW